MKHLWKTLPLLLILFALSGCSKSLHHERVYIPKRGPSIDKEKVALVPRIPKADTNLLIVIDAGHGGKDNGAESVDSPTVYEKNMALTTARLLNTYLQGYGYRTHMTRNQDQFIPLKERASIANNKETRLFVSVHYNAAENNKAKGIEVYYYDTDKNATRTSDSKKLATQVLGKVIHNTKAKSRGIKHGNFAVIRETTMPAILVEGGFMTNKEEMTKIRDAHYMKKIAWGIAEGIRKYLHPHLAH